VGGNRAQCSSLIDDPECIQLRDQLYEKEDFSEVDRNQLIRLCNHLREVSNQYALAQDYLSAIQASDLLIKSRQELIQRNADAGQTGDAQTEEEAREKFEASWSKKFSDYDQESKTRRDRLLEQQSNIEQEFERVWSEEMPRKYRKPSARYLQLKEQERALAISRDFDGANSLHRQNEALLHEETEAAQHSLKVDYKNARVKFTEKQRSDLESSDQLRKNGRILLQQQYERARLQFERRLAVMRVGGVVRGARHRNLNPELGAPVEAIIETKSKLRDVLLPPLIPPNDPSVIEEDRRREEEQKARSQQFSRWNAQRTLSRYNGCQISRPPQEPVHSQPPRPVGNQNERGDLDGEWEVGTPEDALGGVAADVVKAEPDDQGETESPRGEGDAPPAATE
jgi:hypothetical protein